MSPTDIPGLIERVEKATANDAELFREVWWALAQQSEMFSAEAVVEAQYFALVSVGAFIDAALALMERVLPGWFWRAGHVPAVHWHNGKGYDHWCHISRTDASNCDREDEATGWASSVPLAIVLATLNALLRATSTVTR